MLLSLILPYWKRQKATDESLRLMAMHYGDMDLEIIIVDDGSPESYHPPRLTLDIKVIYLPKKSCPLDPCVPYNRGAEKAKGQYIALSNPEILHMEPILQSMVEDASEDPLNYVMAACFCPEQKRWHCHSSRKRTDDNDVGRYLPEGSDYHFMTLMQRSLWDASGGFDEDYRNGAGYDDPDFVRRLHRAGARFIRRDDLVVLHPRKDAHSEWTGEMFSRNRAIFMKKWKPLC